MWLWDKGVYVPSGIGTISNLKFDWYSSCSFCNGENNMLCLYATLSWLWLERVAKCSGLLFSSRTYPFFTLGEGVFFAIISDAFYDFIPGGEYWICNYEFVCSMRGSLTLLGEFYSDYYNLLAVIWLSTAGTLKESGLKDSIDSCMTSLSDSWILGESRWWSPRTYVLTESSSRMFLPLPIWITLDTFD
jgi:hypothetical protein